MSFRTRRLSFNFLTPRLRFLFRTVNFVNTVSGVLDPIVGSGPFFIITLVMASKTFLLSLCLLVLLFA